LIESKVAEQEDFVSLLTVRVRSRESESRVSGTLFGRTQPRIVRVDDFLLEAVPEGSTLLIENRDTPGVVGRIGTTLGSAGVNIARMQLGLAPGGGRALQLLNVDPAPGRAVLDALRALPGIERVVLIDLGAKVI
jgi:D-3-phosphoglycerate dehydrogenase